jgi:hypothetical protein
MTDTLEYVSKGKSPFAVSDPEDFKGLREWVIAKRRSEIHPEKRYPQICSAPWRVG